MLEEELYERDLEHHYNMGVVVAFCKEIIALSKCDYFIDGSRSGSSGTFTMNEGKYEDIYILEDKCKIARY